MIPKSLRWFMALALIILGVALWYYYLPEDQKKFIQNLVRQVPELPGRYAI